MSVEKSSVVCHNCEGPLAADYHIHAPSGDGRSTEGALYEVRLSVGMSGSGKSAVTHDDNGTLTDGWAWGRPIDDIVKCPEVHGREATVGTDGYNLEVAKVVSALVVSDLVKLISSRT